MMTKGLSKDGSHFYECVRRSVLNIYSAPVYNKYLFLWRALVSCLIELKLL